MFLVSGPTRCICSFQTQEGWQKQRKRRKLHWGAIGHPIPVKISCTFSWRRCVIKGSAEVRSHGLFILALKKGLWKSRHICATCIYVDSGLFAFLFVSYLWNSHFTVIHFSYFGVLMAYGGLQDVRMFSLKMYIFWTSLPTRDTAPGSLILWTYIRVVADLLTHFAVSEWEERFGGYFDQESDSSIVLFRSV